MNGAANPLDIWPASASGSAAQTDMLILAFTAVILLLTMPIFVAITYFAIKYRRGRKVDRSNDDSRSNLIELSWMIIPFALTLIFFFWGARLFDRHRHPPPGAIEISAIGRQWMWKFQHPGGQSEINDLHVPTGQPVVLRMISQDVIHALYVPALRIQNDVLPDRYTELWFTANRPGSYHLFCSEYCGTDHSVMGGTITIMTPGDYAAWLSHAGSSGPLAAEGGALFASYGCAACHEGRSSVKAPALAGLYGSSVPLHGGGQAHVDDSFLRAAILDPDAHRIEGFQPVMPSFRGVLAEDDLVRLIAYIKSTGETTERANDIRSPP